MTHDLKIWPEFYEAVCNGDKTFELRKNDRGFQKGDTVILRWFHPGNEYSHESDVRKIWDAKNPPLVFEIGYVLPVDSDRVVFSLKGTVRGGSEK